MLQKPGHEKFYAHDIAAVNLWKIFFQKNAKKICTPSNRGLNSNWIINSANSLKLDSQKRNSNEKWFKHL